MTTLPDNPLKWLLGQLPAYLTPEQHDRLLTAYDAHKRRYYHAAKIRDAERRIKIYEKWPNDKDPPFDGAQDRPRLARWRAKLARLKESEDA